MPRPPKLFRYSAKQWLERSLYFGEFRLVPASSYKDMEGDIARKDNELVRERSIPGNQVTISDIATGKPFRLIGDVNFRDEIGSDYYTLCFSTSWDPLRISRNVTGDFTAS